MKVLVLLYMMRCIFHMLVYFLAYLMTNVFLLFYSVLSPASFPKCQCCLNWLLFLSVIVDFLVLFCSLMTIIVNGLVFTSLLSESRVT